MKTFLRLTAIFVGGALLCFGTIGCNTVKGAGKDIQKGGQSIEKAATAAESK